MSGLKRDPPKSEGYYVQSSNVHRLAISKLDHIAAHIRCLRIITFRSLHRGMAEQELNLLDLAAVCVAQLRTSSAEVVGRNVLQPGLLATTFHDVPHDIL
jgi:hypothetical protein